MLRGPKMLSCCEIRGNGVRKRQRQVVREEPRRITRERKERTNVDVVGVGDVEKDLRKR